MKLKKGHFMILPSAVFFSDLSPREKLTLLTIFSFTSPREDYTISLSNSAFEKATSMDERTVKKALIELQEKGLINVNYPNGFTRTITLNVENLIKRFDIQVEDEKQEKNIKKTLDKSTPRPYTYKSEDERRADSIKLAEKRKQDLNNYPYRKKEL